MNHSGTTGEIAKQMMNNCRCFHHGFAKFLMVLSGISAILFLYATWFGGENKVLFDLTSFEFFMHFIIFSLATAGTRSCKCCCGVGCGKNCGSGMCMPGDNKMGGMNSGSNMDMK